MNLTMHKVNRKSHVGKSSSEKEAYKNFLNQRFKLDKTEEDPENLSKTDASSFESDDDLENIKPKRKSWKLKIADFFQSNWTITIVGGIIVLIIGWVISSASEQGVQKAKLDGVENRVSKVEQKVDNISSDVNKINDNVNLIKVGFTKDIEFIKDKISGR